MSLLMDALKKAEEAKRQSEASAKPVPQTNAPAGAAAEKRGLPELPSRLELLDHEFRAPPGAKPEPAAAAPAPEHPAGPSAEALMRERAAAQNMFAAKQPAQNRNFLLVVGLATLIAVAGIGGYFWWQLQPKGGLGPAPVAVRTAPHPPSMAAAPAASPPAPAAAPPAAAPSVDKPAAASPRPAFAERTPPVVAAPPAAPEPESPIRITSARLKVNPQIASAYQSFQSGDLAAAERDYRQVLKNEPKNIDALHGLAAISLSRGQPEAAEDFYLGILEADPKDSAAQAGLIGLRGQADPTQSESRLKNLLATQPDSPTLNFALGNLYARQGRWNDAQQAYFRAYAADADNPDYQFNLAVSLEQLRQPRLALQYYRGALAAAAQRPAAFDRNQVAGRVSELQK